jgi:cobalt-precorrin 5A hydrolase/precorrin-3B C17-methyltransferase
MIWGLGFSEPARPLLERLRQARLVQATVHSGASPGPGTVLQQQWDQAEAFVVVAACGLVTRLIAPLLSGKDKDPAVVVLDPEGRYAIPLLGGHAAGGEALSQRLAAALGGTAVITGSSGAMGRLALDAFGSAWGWRRGSGDWSDLMHKAARQPVTLLQQGGLTTWQELAAAAELRVNPASDEGADLVISDQVGPGCRWHPPRLWLGMGCERHTSLEVLERLMLQTLEAHGLAQEAVAGLASIDRKGDEPALLELAARHGWPLKLFSAAQLAPVPVPNPSAVVEQEMGTASVAEAAALLAAGHQSNLPKRCCGAADRAPPPWRLRQPNSSGHPTAELCI